MTLKYNCPSCDALLYTAFLKPGDTTLCHKCGETIVVPENARPSDSLVDIAKMAFQKGEDIPEGYSRPDEPSEVIPAIIPAEPQLKLPNYKYPGFWQALGLIVLFLLILVALYIPVGCASVISKVKLHRIPTVENVLNIVSYFLILLIGLKIGGLPFTDVFLFKKIKPGLIVSIVACSVGVILVTVPIIYWIAVTLGIQSDTKNRLLATIDHPYAVFFSLVIIAPIFEELFFRGLILRGFLARYTAKKAIIVNALLFAVMHGNPLRIFATFFLGLFNAWLRYRSNSIIPSIFAHAFNNAMVFFVFLIFRDEDISEIPDKAEFWEPFMVLLVGILILSAGVWLIRKQMAKIAAADIENKGMQTAIDDLM